MCLHVSLQVSPTISPDSPAMLPGIANAITVLNASQLPYQPTRIFISTSNQWYVAVDGYTSILSGFAKQHRPNYSMHQEDTVCSSLLMKTCILTMMFNNQVSRWSINTTTSLPVMLINDFSSRPVHRYEQHALLRCILHGSSRRKVTRWPHEYIEGSGWVRLRRISIKSTDRVPAGIFVDLNFQPLFVADIGNHRVQRFIYGQENGTTVAGNGASGTISLNSARADVVLDGDGYIFIVDTNNHRIVGCGPDGFRCVAGCSNTTGSASNQLSLPQSMGFDSDGNIWVADYGNRRVQKFVISRNYSGQYQLKCISSTNSRIESVPLILESPQGEGKSPRKTSMGTSSLR